MRRKKVDVAIIGAGVTGLFLTMKLAELGRSAILIEMRDKIAGGPSTRNEGWLHRGTYHAASIKDRRQAIQVARRCIYGHEQIRRFAPEAVELLDTPAYALAKDPERADEALSRWDEAGVQYRRVSHREFRNVEPHVNISGVAVIAAVADVAVNTRLLYAKAAAHVRRSGAQIVTGAQLTDPRGNEATLQIQGQSPVGLSARLFVHTGGFRIRDFFRDHFSVELPMRFWKSHLLVLERRAAQHGVFFLDAGEAAMMNHGEHSIVGLNEDAQLVDEPTYEPIPEGITRVRQALRRLVPDADLSGCLETACVKVDMPASEYADRSLNVAYGQPVPNHLWVLPGKMTEAPFVTDVLANLIFEKLKGRDDLVALRPCDRWTSQSAESQPRTAMAVV